MKSARNDATNWYKTLFWGLVGFLLFLSLVCWPYYRDYVTPSQPKAQTEAARERFVFPDDFPVQPDDLLAMRFNSLDEIEDFLGWGEDGPMMLKTSVKVLVASPYGPQKLPVSFTKIREFTGGPLGSPDVMHIFDDFANVFIYDDPVMKFSGRAEHAMTFRKGTGTILAEGHLIATEAGEKMRIVEIHYHQGGDIIFVGISTIGGLMGEKISEEVIFGQKETDYYFYWPAMAF